jgi:tRNA pseudouridine(55) synthase
VHGWIILDKPLGLGSTQGVSAVKRALRQGGYAKVKVGHGGTLDPLATGVLPIALGEATKMAGRMLDASKIYAFTITFGTQTDTLDLEGLAVAQSDVRPTLADVEAVLLRFTGPIDQVPPAYSALKVDGQRAYDLARSGEGFELATRSVNIFELGVMSAEAEPALGSVTLSAHVSKGTYIRSLARDIAIALGTVGHVTMLRRTRAGPFDLSQAISLDLLDEAAKGATLEASWRNWEECCTAAIRRMQELETENNRLFIAAYGLDGELQPEVPEEQITLARADTRRDMAAFLSYAVGCMMGRYSPDHPGLILANAGDTLREFLEKVGKPLTELTFTPDEDGIIPVLDKEWFDDDIVARTRDFLRATFGDESLNANIQFIEQSLGKDLRKYFLTDFYKDHLQTYKKRPIYWLFSSGKQRAFQCLVYLHRYNEGTLARMRTEYVMPLQGRIAARIEQLEGDKIKATSTSHGNKLQKEQDDLKKQQAELLLFDETLRHIADKKISLDLDEGVKVNYAKFDDLLAESRAICGTKDDD